MDNMSVSFYRSHSAIHPTNVPIITSIKLCAARYPPQLMLLATYNSPKKPHKPAATPVAFMGNLWSIS